MTLFIYFHQMRFQDFKRYYLGYVKPYLSQAFPGLVSYNRFIELLPTISIPLCAFLQGLTEEKTGIYFVDSLRIKACHIRREKQHRVFKDIAHKGKCLIGWMYGFKPTAANVNDRKPYPI